MDSDPDHRVPSVLLYERCRRCHKPLFLNFLCLQCRWCRIEEPPAGQKPYYAEPCTLMLPDVHPGIPNWDVLFTRVPVSFSCSQPGSLSQYALSYLASATRLQDNKQAQWEGEAFTGLDWLFMYLVNVLCWFEAPDQTLIFPKGGSKSRSLAYPSDGASKN